MSHIKRSQAQDKQDNQDLCDNFHHGFKGAPRRAGALGPASLSRQCSSIADRDSARMAETDRQQRAELARGAAQQWGGSLARCLCAERRPASGRLPHVRSPASARSRATRRNAPFGGRARRKRSGGGPAPVGLEPLQVTEALPPDPGPPSRMSGQVVIPSLGQVRPYAGTPGAARARCARPCGQTLAAPENPAQPARVPDRGDDLTQR